MITFAIPYYSNPRFLKEAVESVLEQRSPHWRLILVDDSKDGHLQTGHGAWLESLLRDSRIRYVRNERNLGMIGAWNRCFELSETEFVTLLHADDLLLPNYVDLMEELSSRHTDACAYFCDTMIIGGRGKRVFSFPDSYKKVILAGAPSEMLLQGDEWLARLFRGNFIMCPTLCYRRSEIPSPPFQGGWKMVQDLEFTSRMLMQGKRIVGTRAKAYAYRRHAENATSAYNRNLLRFEEESKLYSQRADELASMGWRKASEAARSKQVIRNNLFYCAMKDLLGLRFRPAQSKFRFLGRL